MLESIIGKISAYLIYVYYRIIFFYFTIKIIAIIVTLTGLSNYKCSKSAAYNIVKNNRYKGLVKL